MAFILEILQNMGKKFVYSFEMVSMSQASQMQATNNYDDKENNQMELSISTIT